jgi:putative tryptophan/tyrosine transport system substrate-binding protein
MMRRRAFIAGLGSAAVCPLAARGQQAAMPVVGYLHTQTPKAAEKNLSEIRLGLAETGYFEGRNVVIEYRFAENRIDRLPTLAADLVRRGVAVIVAVTASATFPAKAATSSIPIVFILGGDPVEQLRLVASYNKPGGNLTGITISSNDLWAKRMGLMRELVPSAKVFAVLLDPNAAGAPRARAASPSRKRCWPLLTR